MVSEARRGRSRLTVLLIASLGLNLFLGSLWIGRWVAGPHLRQHIGLEQPRRTGESAGRMIVDRMASALPAEHRAVFEGVMAKHRPAVAEAAQRFHESRDKVRDALAKDPFDPGALDEAFAEQRANGETLQSLIQASIAEAAASLPPEARQRLADWRAHSRRPR